MRAKACRKEAERAAIWARLGHVHLQRTRRMEDAIDAFQRALAVLDKLKSV